MTGEPHKDPYEEVLLDNRLKLAKVNPDGLWNCLLKARIVTKNERDKIRKDIVQYDQVPEIADIIAKKGQDAFVSFCNCLEKDYKHLADELRTQLKQRLEHKPPTDDDKIRRSSIPPSQVASLQSNATVTYKDHRGDKLDHHSSGENVVGNASGDRTEPTTELLLDHHSSGENVVGNASGDRTKPTTERLPGQEPRECSWKTKPIIYGVTFVTTIGIIITVVTVLISKSQTTTESTLSSTASLIKVTDATTASTVDTTTHVNVTAACLNAEQNGTQPVIQDDGRCVHKDPGFYPHDGSCASFYLCCEDGKLAGEGTCPQNYFFHPESQLCVDTRDTFYRDPSNCGKYYQCYGTPPRRTEQRSCHMDAYFRLQPPPPTCAHRDNVKDCHQKPLVPILDNVTSAYMN